MEMDLFKHTLIWQRPIGRSHPYSISVQIDDNNSKNVLNWTLTVKPSYNPIVVNVSMDIGGTNRRIALGHVEFDEKNVTVCSF